MTTRPIVMRSTLALALSIILFHSHFYANAQPNTPKKSLAETIKEAEDIYGIKIFYKEESGFDRKDIKMMMKH